MRPGAIRTPGRLAQRLAEHAQRLRAAVLADPLPGLAGELGFADPAEFADGYAQAVGYGLFAVRWLARARPELASTGAPALALLDRLVDSLGSAEQLAELDAITELLASAELEQLFAGRPDPTIHFYPEFLASYDPQRRRAQGVYYTPTELAEYVVACVDSGLRERFGLALGLADPRVEIVDPAVGTGGFLLAALDRVHATMQAEYAGLDPAGAAAAWSAYVRADLLPRLRGLELALAPALVCQLRLAFALAQTGFAFAPADALRIVRADALAAELRSERPIAVMLGNPPYQRGHRRPGELVERLVAPFKHAVRDERNIQPLADDYIAFMGLGLDYVDHADAGALALVVNGTCLVGRLHRGLRARLLERCEFVALTDLHGGQKVARREGDENLFDIQQGVAIVQAERRGTRAAAPTILHHDLLGSRAAKLAWLRARTEAAPLREHAPICASAPLHLFDRAGPIPAEYADFVPLPEIFDFYSVSGKPGKDELLVGFDRDELIPRLEARRAALAGGLGPAATEAERKLAARPAAQPFEPARLRPYSYRPGDTRWTYYDPDIWTRAVTALSERLDGAPVLLTSRLVKDASFAHVWVTRGLADVICLSATSSVNCYSFPLTDNIDISEIVSMDNVREIDAFDYIYAVLHSPGYRRRYADALRHDFPRVPIPAGPEPFVALAGLGARLRTLHLLEAPAELDPAVARFVDGGDRRVTRVGEPRRGLAPSSPGLGRLHINEHSYFDRVPESAYSLRVGGYQLLHKWLADRKKAGRSLSDADVAHYRVLVDVALRTLDLMARVDATVAELGGWPAAFNRPR